jgi:hypothetical protein
VIYFLQSTDGGPVKIGTTEDVEARRRQLESHYGKPLALLATLPGGRDEEAEIHERFGYLRLGYPGRSEPFPVQFRSDPELMAFLGRPLAPAEAPPARRPDAKLSGWQRQVLIDIAGDYEARSGRERGWGVPIGRWPDGLGTAAQRAAYSRGLRRLEGRGLILRQNIVAGCPATSKMRNSGRESHNRTTHIQLTGLGVEVAKRLTKDATDFVNRFDDDELPEG